jgi:hypothetical protein
MDNSKNQMEMLFDEGGIADDGMNVDPVSGNEIPPGSMASEVRDDIPAQLSEGEYVVPADVLRFYGVKFFEDLRSEAKQGMSQMEADGRIGGEPVGMEDPRGAQNPLTPEEMAVLQEMGMAVGGMVPQPTQSTDPYMQQQRMYQQPSPVAMGNTGYDEGGAVTAFDPSQYGAGFSFLSPSTPTETAPAVTTVMLYSPDGLTTQAFSLPAQQTDYDAKIAEGWTTTQVQAPQVTTQTSVDKDEDYGGPVKPTTGKGNKPYSKMTPDELKEAYSSNNKARTIMQGMAVINPVLGVAGLGAIKYAEKQILEAMKDKGLDLPDPENPTAEEGGILSGIADWFSETFGTKKDKEPVVKPKGTATVTPTTSTPSSYDTTSDAQIKKRQDDRSDRSSEISVGQSNVSKGMSGKSTDYKTAATEAATQSLSSEEKKGGAALDESFGITGLNKGGLMQKKKKK